MKIEGDFQIPCPKCGGHEYRIPENADEDSLIECDKCGFTASLQDLREHGLQLAKDHVLGEVQKQIKKSLGRHFK